MHTKHRISILLLCALLVGLGSGFPVAAEQKIEDVPQYNYYMRCTKDWDFTDNTIVLELHVIPDGNQEVLGGGNFGLRFPKNMGKNLKFEPNEDHVSISQVVPPERVVPVGGDVIKKDEYMAFGWLKSIQVAGWPITSTIPGADRHLFIGTFTFTNVAAQPFKTDIGIMNFLNMPESIPTELPESERGDPAKDAFNITVWDAENGRYMGCFPGDDLTIERTGMGLQWTPPSAWKNAFTVLSYDPKKPMTVELCNKDGTPIADAITAPLWIDTTTEDSAILYSATEANANKGTGAYFAAVDFADFKKGETQVEATAGTEYILRIKKACHLTVELKLTATSKNFAECKGFPKDNAPVYLPCGDINPVADEVNVGKYIFGDGAITLTDRSLLTAFLDMKIEVKSSFLEEVEGEKTPAYFADLDGDGAITLVDLSILTSGQNFAKRSQ